MTNETPDTCRRVLVEVLAAAKERDYAGYGKFDALNSPLLSRLTLDRKWLRILFTQAVKECPVNIRPLLGVGRSRNPKGIALFARAYLSLFETAGDERFLDEARNLVGWLLDNVSPGQEHLCWGYNFVWQSPLFLQDRNEPNVVVTIFAGEALVHAWRVTKDERYLDAALSVGRFLTDSVPVLYENDEERAIAYVLGKVDAVVLNNNALAGALLAKLWKETGSPELLDSARKLVTYTVNRRTEYNAWYYTHPRRKSHITHDNYHTGGILDAILEYCEETGDDTFMDCYHKGLAYYARSLFEEDGAPKWMNDRRFPRDIHGSAQGIITFSKAASHDIAWRELAVEVFLWTQGNLYRPETRDYAYRKGRFITWNYSLMRWCNAWMARALGELIGIL
ncbi:MAG: hypothetical protein J7M24_03110 [Candidatus Latescibacteria bacterium]|nr:hypothetical protein [Candidatus Latescibacterota bacterium]